MRYNVSIQYLMQIYMCCYVLEEANQVTLIDSDVRSLQHKAHLLQIEDIGVTLDQLRSTHMLPWKQFRAKIVLL